MSARCPACFGTGLLAGGETCACITGEMRRIEAAKHYKRSSVPPLCTGTQTSADAVRARALNTRRAQIAASMMRRSRG